MPAYLALLGMLALGLAPSLVARAEEPPFTAPAPPAETADFVKTPVEIPADYPEDFSQPDAAVATRENRHEAFGEDEAIAPRSPSTSAAESLNDPFE